MRILVVGAGATGGYFGALLADAGRDVTFLVRPGRAEQLRRAGLQIVGPLGARTVQPALITAERLETPFDVVLLGVKGYALESALADFAPAVGADTTIVPMLNGMRHLDILAERFAPGNVLGGICYVISTLDAQGRIVLFDTLQRLVYGELDGSVPPRLTALDALLSGAGFETQCSTTVVAQMWEKWVVLAALGGINSLLRGTIGEIVAVPGGAALAQRMFDECVAIATAAGFRPRDEMLVRAGRLLSEPGAARASSLYRDLTKGEPVEVEQIPGDLLTRGQALNLDTPLLAAAVAQLRVYERARTDGPVSVAG